MITGDAAGGAGTILTGPSECGDAECAEVEE
jgi:hypothetical protein